MYAVTGYALQAMSRTSSDLHRHPTFLCCLLPAAGLQEAGGDLSGGEGA